MDPISFLTNTGGVSPLRELGPTPAQGLSGAPGGPGFGEVLGSFLHNVDQSQHRSAGMVESLALGEPVDIHQVMLSLNEASSALQLTMQVRNKVLEAYQELMRTPL